MVAPLVGAALIGGGATVLGSLLGSRDNKQNIAAAGQMDAQNRAWQESQYFKRNFDTLGRENYNTYYDTTGDFNAVFKGQGGSDQLLRDRDYEDYKRTAEINLGNTKTLDASRYNLERQAKVHDFNNLKNQGLTPQEIVGSPIGGGVGGSAPSGQTLGSATATQNALTKASSDMVMARERSADRAMQMRVESMRANTSLLTTAMQTGSTLGGQLIKRDTDTRGQDIQEKGIIINAETIQRGQDIQKQAANNSVQANLKIAKDKLSLDRDKYSNIELPQAVNNIATSTPGWQRQKILATMGVDNILATAMAGDFGIDPMNPATLKSISPEQFTELVRRIYGYSSKVYGEIAGARQIANEDANAAIRAAKKVTDWVQQQSNQSTPRAPTHSKPTSIGG